MAHGNITHYLNNLVYYYANKMRNFKKILYWLLIIFIIYLIIELIRKILGGSLEFEEIIIGLLIANLGYSFYINSKVSEHIGWHKGRED